MNKKILALLLAVFVTVLPLSSCAAKNDDTIDIGIGRPFTVIDPAYDESLISCHLLEGLTREDVNGNIVAGMAEKWVANEDYTEYTFTLRDATWSDGHPVTAEDFEYSWKRTIATADYTTLSAMMCLENATDIVLDNADPSTLGVEAVDEKTLEVHLSRSVKLLPELLSESVFLPVRQDNVESGLGTEDGSVISNGPFVISTLTAERVVVHKREDYYNASAITTKKLVFRFYDDAEVLISDYKNDVVDFAMSLDRSTAEKIRSGSSENHAYDGSCLKITFNVNCLALNHPDVRLGLSYCIDRTYIVDTLLSGFDTSAGALVPSGNWTSSGAADFRTTAGDIIPSDLLSYTTNQQLAVDSFARAGYANGRGLLGFTLLCPDDEVSVSIAETIAGVWNETLGTNAKVEALPYDDFLLRVTAGEFDCALTSGGSTYSSLASFFIRYTTDHPSNYGHYSNQNYDSYVAYALENPDDSECLDSLHKAEELLCKTDAAIAPICFTNELWIYTKKLTGVRIASLGTPDFTWAVIEK